MLCLAGIAIARALQTLELTFGTALDVI